MRALLLLVIVLPVCALALIKPRYGLLGLMCFTLVRPDVLAYSRHIPFSLMLEAAVGLGSLAHLNRMRNLLQNPICRSLLILQLPVAFSMVLAIDFWLGFRNYPSYVGGVFSALVIPLLIETEEEFRQLMLVITFSIALISSKFGLFGFIHGGVRLANGYGAMLSDNNTLALFMAMGVPLAWYARGLLESKILRLALLGLVVVNIGGVVFTYSRGAALALAGGFVLVAYNARRRLLLLAGLVILTIPALYLVGNPYFLRVQTLQDPTHETSAMGRIEDTKVAFRMAAHYPLLGVGFGTLNQIVQWHRYTNMSLSLVGNGTWISSKIWVNGMVIHNTYLQMMTDSGVPAAIIYTVMLWGTIVWLQRSAKRLLRLNSKLAAYPLGLGASLVVFAIGSTFLSRVAFDAEYILLMCAAAWWNLEPACLESAEEEQLTDEEEASVSFASQPA